MPEVKPLYKETPNRVCVDRLLPGQLGLVVQGGALTSSGNHFLRTESRGAIVGVILETDYPVLADEAGMVIVTPLPAGASLILTQE